MLIKNKIKEIRRNKNITQRELSIKSGISERNIQKIESGKQDPRVSTAIKIAEILDIRKLEEFKKLFYLYKKNS